MVSKAVSIEKELHHVGSTQEDEQTGPPKSFREKVDIVLSNITVEPVVVLLVLPSIMSGIATQNLNLEKACRVNLDLGTELCDSLTSRNSSGYNSSDEADVQKLVASMYVWKNIVQSFIPAMLLLFFGSWSDRHKRRKPCILLPVFGEALSCVGFLLCTYFFFELPMEVNGVAEAVPPALLGGWFNANMAMYCYISEHSTIETRTIRIGTVSMIASVSLMIGIALSGILYNKLGLYGVFTLSLLLYIVAIAYGSLRIKEGSESKEEKKKGVEFLKDFFDTKCITETLRVAFKKREGNKRKQIGLIIIVGMIIFGPAHGEYSVLYLFVRYRYQWDELDYSIYFGYNVIIHSVGMLILLVVFSKLLKMDDALIGVISTSSKVLSSFIYTFAPNSFVFYLATTVEMFTGMSYITMRSIISKLVPADELGKINSLFGVCEALMPVIYGPLYSAVYKSTIAFLPGTFFLLGGALTFPAVLIYFWLYLQNKQSAKEEILEKSQKQELLNVESSKEVL